MRLSKNIETLMWKRLLNPTTLQEPANIKIRTNILKTSLCKSS